MKLWALQTQTHCAAKAQPCSNGGAGIGIRETKKDARNMRRGGQGPKPGQCWIINGGGKDTGHGGKMHTLGKDAHWAHWVGMSTNEGRRRRNGQEQVGWRRGGGHKGCM
jgi:hypothetical protein